MDCNIFEVWEEYKDGLYGFIHKRVNEEDDAKYILQEVLLKSYQYCSTGKSVEHLKAWLYKITLDGVADCYRSNQKHLTVSAELAGE